MPKGKGREAFWAGVRALLPLVPGVVPFGLVTGVMAADMGMSPGTTIGMTVLFHSGAAQMAALQLLRDDVWSVAIVFTALVINLRFVMYSASFAPYLHHLPRRWTWSLAYLMSDQAYALSALKLTSGQYGDRGHLFYTGTAVALWLVWDLSVVAGIYLGAGIPDAWALDFAIPLSFLAILIPAIQGSASLTAAVVGGAVAVFAHGLPYNLGLVLASVCGIAAGLAVERMRGPDGAASQEEAAS